MTVEVYENDAASLAVLVNALTVAENGGEKQYTVALNTQPTGTVTIDLMSSDTGPVKVSPAALAFEINEWNIPAVVTVTGVNDDLDNPGDQREATITHTPSGGGYDDVDPRLVTVTVTDDDTAGVVVSAPAPPAALRISEGGRPASYTIKLASKPTAMVTVNVVNDDSDVIQIEPDEVIFGSHNWNMEQEVRVIASGSVGGQAVIKHTVVSNDDNYGGIDVGDVAAVVTTKLTVSVEGDSSCVVGGEQAVFNVLADRVVSSDLPVQVYVGQNWRVLEGGLDSDLDRIHTVTVRQGSGSAKLSLATQNPPDGKGGDDTPEHPDYVERSYGDPGVVQTTVQPSGDYDIGTAYAVVEVYHSEEAHFCQP